MEVDIKQYLTEEDLIEIAKDEYRRVVREGLKTDDFGFKTLDKKKRLSNMGRIISNTIYYYLENEAEEILGKNIDLHKHIKKNVEKTIKANKDYGYSVFRRKGTFDTEDSLGCRLLDSAVLEHKDYITQKVKEGIDEFFNKKDADDWNEIVQEIITGIVSEKFNLK